MGKSKSKKAKVQEVVVDQASEQVVQETLAMSEAIIEAAAPVVVAKEEIVQVQVENGEKIGGITKANYKANLARANELKGRLIVHLSETGGFPSHRFIQKTWGYNISLKAIIRHKSKIAKAQGLEKIATTDSLPRPKKVAKAEVQEPVTA